MATGGMPKDFLGNFFKLTPEGIIRISQFVISSDLRFSDNVYAFTQEGLAMPSGVLHSECVAPPGFLIRTAADAGLL